MSIKQISMEFGYYDTPHFNHDFKKKTGLTPLEWRMRSLGRK